MNYGIEAAICEVLRRYPVKRAALFGSASRGDMTDSSDIDLIVEFLPVRVGLLFYGLHDELQNALSCHVDLLTYDGLFREAKPTFRESVLRDERVIYERES